MQAGTPPPQTVDELQASFLACLRAAGGEPLSFEQLRSLGFENPATLCYELEMAEIPLRRVERRSGPGCAVAFGVQLAPEAAQVPERSTSSPLSVAAVSQLRRLANAAPRRMPQGTPPRSGLASSERLVQRIAALRDRAQHSALESFEHPSRRAAIAAVALLLILAVAGWTLALTRHPASVRSSASSLRARTASTARSAILRPSAPRSVPRVRHPPAAKRAKTPPVRSAQPAPAERLASATPVARARHRTPHRSTPTADTGGTAAPTSDAAGAAAPAVKPQQHSAPSHSAPTKSSAVAQSAAQLQTDGHQLLGEGRYGAAVSDLRAAIATSGGSLSTCATPTSEPCLIYAYALYDLGRALWLSGDAQAAIGALEERMQIDNQREAVQEELALVRSASR